ncbi:hypothetical protein PS1_017356 [Malus domestica]
MFKSQKARDAKDRLETVASQAQKMNNIVTEQWIQIQRLEQAFHSTQDDAHIFCRESQVKDEVKGVLHFIQYTYNIFGFSFDLKLSTVNGSYYAVYAVRFTISCRYEQHGKVKEEVIKLKEQFSHLKSLPRPTHSTLFEALQLFRTNCSKIPALKHLRSLTHPSGIDAPKPLRHLGGLLVEIIAIDILRSTNQLTAAVEVGEGDVMLEIRLRTGSLTNVLINAGAFVLAIKKDPHMATHVSERFAETDRFKVLKEDFVKCRIHSHVVSLLACAEPSVSLP